MSERILLVNHALIG